MRLHPSVNTLTTVEGIFACKNALGVRTVAASASTFPIAPDVLVARASAPALAAVLSAALDQARAGALTSCSLPAPDGLSESFSFVWHGRGARVNRFAIAVGFSGLYPPCSAEAEALLFAVQAYAAGLPMAPGAEVDIFPH